MNWVSDALVTLIASAGGVSVVIAGLSGYAGRVFSERFIERLKGELSRELETHRARLKKSEILFARELEAATTFVAFRAKMMPSYRHPSMDWHETCDEIACDFGKHERYLDNFIAEHGAVIPDIAATLISEASAIAGEFKFEATSDGPDLQVSMQANAAADRFYKKVREAERALLDGIRDQIAA